MHRTTVGPDDSISQMGSEIISEVSEAETQVAAEQNEGGPRPPEKDEASKAAVQRRPRRSIFIGYSPDAGYLERKLVLETVKQLKVNGLSENIWFDADEKVADTCCSLAHTLDAVERCRAALLFLSESFFTSSLSLHVGQTLVERLRDKDASVSVFSVLIGPINAEHVPDSASPLFQRTVDLHEPQWREQSVAEKCTAVLGAYMVELERFSVCLVPFLPAPFGSNCPGELRSPLSPNFVPTLPLAFQVTTRTPP